MSIESELRDPGRGGHTRGRRTDARVERDTPRVVFAMSPTPGSDAAMRALDEQVRARVSLARLLRVSLASGGSNTVHASPRLTPPPPFLAQWDRLAKLAGDTPGSRSRTPPRVSRSHRARRGRRAGRRGPRDAGPTLGGADDDDDDDGISSRRSSRRPRRRRPRARRHRRAHGARGSPPRVRAPAPENAARLERDARDAAETRAALDDESARVSAARADLDARESALRAREADVERREAFFPTLAAAERALREREDAAADAEDAAREAEDAVADRVADVDRNSETAQRRPTPDAPSPTSRTNARASHRTRAS